MRATPADPSPQRRNENPTAVLKRFFDEFGALLAAAEQERRDRRAQAPARTPGPAAQIWRAPSTSR